MRFATSFAALAFLIVGLSLASPISPVMSGWTGKATAHFAIFTAHENAGAQELLERLERTRLFFEKMGWPSKDLKQPLRILAFGSEKEFDAYRPISAAFAFYQHTREGDFVLMRSLEPEHYSIVVHEYTHFIVEQSGLKLPLWLNEGLADFYSTMESRNAQAVFGAPPPGRENTLRSNDWMDWQALSNVDHDSPYYRQLDKMQLFYSQSWALVHLLVLGNTYESKFHGFLKTISGPPPTADPWSPIYQKTLRELGSETQQQFKENRLKPQVVDLDIRTGALQSAEVADPIKQTEYVLADVQAANPKAFDEAKLRLEMLALKYPDDPHAEESLGFLLWRAGRKNEAEQCFARAVKNRSQDSEVLFLLAHLELAHGGSADEAMDLLQRSLAEKPENYNALLELGFAAAKSEKFDLAADTLQKITSPPPENAFPITYTLAYCLSELKQNNRARDAAERSQKIATNPQDKQQAAQLLSYIQQEMKEEEASR
jgi:tetratricopeptide (TPR) repeat protein